tara:strand:+ start:482 stop:589 length:108 start_codon:yes stop_codon:yes gene_type:complete
MQLFFFKKNKKINDFSCLGHFLEATLNVPRGLEES